MMNLVVLRNDKSETAGCGTSSLESPNDLTVGPLQDLGDCTLPTAIGLDGQDLDRHTVPIHCICHRSGIDVDIRLALGIRDHKAIAIWVGRECACHTGSGIPF